MRLRSVASHVRLMTRGWKQVAATRLLLLLGALAVVTAGAMCCLKHASAGRHAPTAISIPISAITAGTCSLRCLCCCCCYFRCCCCWRRAPLLFIAPQLKCPCLPLRVSACLCRFAASTPAQVSTQLQQLLPWSAPLPGHCDGRSVADAVAAAGCYSSTCVKCGGGWTVCIGCSCSSSSNIHSSGGEGAGKTAACCSSSKAAAAAAAAATIAKAGGRWDDRRRSSGN